MDALPQYETGLEDLDGMFATTMKLISDYRVAYMHHHFAPSLPNKAFERHAVRLGFLSLPLNLHYYGLQIFHVLSFTPTRTLIYPETAISNLTTPLLECVRVEHCLCVMQSLECFLVATAELTPPKIYSGQSDAQLQREVLVPIQLVHTMSRVGITCMVARSISVARLGAHPR